MSEPNFSRAYLFEQACVVSMPMQRSSGALAEVHSRAVIIYTLLTLRSRFRNCRGLCQSGLSTLPPRVLELVNVRHSTESRVWKSLPQLRRMRNWGSDKQKACRQNCKQRMGFELYKLRGFHAARRAERDHTALARCSTCPRPITTLTALIEVGREGNLMPRTRL